MENVKNIFSIHTTVLALHVLVMVKPCGITTSFVNYTRLQLSSVYGAWMTFSQFDSTIFLITGEAGRFLFLLGPLPSTFVSQRFIHYRASSDWGFCCSSRSRRFFHFWRGGARKLPGTSGAEEAPNLKKPYNGQNIDYQMLTGRALKEIRTCRPSQL